MIGEEVCDELLKLYNPLLKLYNNEKLDLTKTLDGGVYYGIQHLADVSLCETFNPATANTQAFTVR